MDDITRELKSAIAVQIGCLSKPSINAFAGTGRSRRRHAGDIHAIARQLMERGTFGPFSFHWDFGNREPAGRHDVYLTVFTALFDIDDDDAKRWTDRAEWDIARHEAAGDIARALTRKFDVAKRRLTLSQADPENPGQAGSAHSLSNSRYEDNRDW
ncbi:hypothetical protein [Rhizobium sp. LC145]|uniref:hypothetical protein n=1 Tax=Rhizobium sp. LC145 TaxID=1120688 RepID=UPI000629F019|nr:hypothetical protein [Rhizobium sp. LC145]KKX24296.1 hypothetical protein YH62_27445 [Rhizobium sp. LC145]TKT46165.1 hypothetical protein FDR95_23690 [Rhizobiaceae bacterium LC148]